MSKSNEEIAADILIAAIQSKAIFAAGVHMDRAVDAAKVIGDAYQVILKRTYDEIDS